MTTLIFDWGGTIMVDFEKAGPMYSWDEVAWVSGAENALERLSPEYPCCIATSAGISDTPAMIKALQRVGADRYFRRFFSAREIGYDKPDPRFYQEICHRMGVTASSCIMTGNDYRRDIQGAREAGLMTVFFNAYGQEGSFGDADEVITRMEDLPVAIERIVRRSAT